MNSRVWLVGCLVIGFLLSPSSAWATDENPEKFRSILLSLKGNKVDVETVNIISSLVTANLAQYEALDLVTSSDIKNMASLEAEKQSVGCSDETSCLAELAGAMDARYVIFGDVGQLGPLLILSLNLFDAREAKAVSRMVVQTKDLEQFPNKLNMGIKKFMKPVVDFSVAQRKANDTQVAVAEPVAAAPRPAPKTVPAKVATDEGINWAWVKMGVGAVSLGAAVAAFVWSSGQEYGEYLEAYEVYRDDVQAGNIPEQSFTQQDYDDMQGAYESTNMGQGLGAAFLSLGAGFIAWALVDLIPVEGE